MLRGQIATFEIDEAALTCAAERAVDLAKAGSRIRHFPRR